jgi:ABC-2 type transport system ATP-binding protein
VVAHAPLSQLTQAGATTVRLLAEQPDALEAALLAHGLVASDREGDAMSVSGASQRDVARIALDHGVLVYELAVAPSSLEDAFFGLTQQAEETLR